MPYFTEQQLYRFADSPSLQARAAQFLNESVETARLSIFLSHSHKDRKKARGIIRYFASLGVEVYVDWNDRDMPRETSQVTAEKIKDRIVQFDLCMVLLTRNACGSKWVPWEIGVADVAKGESRVLVVPVVDSHGSYYGMEFLRLYRRVALSTGGATFVLQPGRSVGPLLESYFERFAL
jgi:hypothetical protein